MFRILTIIAVILTVSCVFAQDILEVKEHWEVTDSLDFRCQNISQRGGDINNDGYDDYINLADSYPQNYFQYYQGSNPLSFTYECFCDVSFGSSTASWAGDLNNDGYNDMVFTVMEHMFYPVETFICWGSDDMTLEPELLTFPFRAQYLHTLNGGFDFNGDGLDDLMFYGNTDMIFDGIMAFLFGGDDFPLYDFVMHGEEGHNFGNSFAIGDLNGDGFDDYIGSRDTDDYHAYMEVYLGSAIPDTICDYTLPEDVIFDYGRVLTADLNNDGRDEIVYPSADGVLCYFINENDELDFYDADLNYTGTMQTADINGDGIDDLMLWDQDNDILRVHYGGDNFIEGICDAEIPMPECSSNNNRNRFFCNLGDMNGDGKDEILVNDGNDEGGLSNTATIYGLQNNAKDDYCIEDVYSKISNFPNPFNPVTNISFSIPEDSQIELNVYNTKGQKIKSLISGNYAAGDHSIIWNGNDDSGKNASSGIYFYKLILNGETAVINKCLLLK